MKLNLPRERFFLGPAALWKRAAAFLADFILIDFIIFSPFQRLITKLLPAKDFAGIQEVISNNPSLMHLVLSVLTIAGILAMLYFVLLEYLLGTTVGKHLLRINVVSENKLHFWQCFVRHLYFIPLFPLPLLWIIEPVFMLFSKDNSSLLERLSKTRTIERMMLG